MLLEISQNSQENTCARVSFLKKFQASNFIKKVPQACNIIKKRDSVTGVFLWIAKFLTTPILTEHLRWLLLNVSRILELKKRTDQNFVIQNLLHGKQYCMLKQCQEQVIYEYILAFAGWWSIFGEVLGGGGYILAGGGW